MMRPMMVMKGDDKEKLCSLFLFVTRAQASNNNCRIYVLYHSPLKVYLSSTTQRVIVIDKRYRCRHLAAGCILKFNTFPHYFALINHNAVKLLERNCKYQVSNVEQNKSEKPEQKKI